MGRKRKYIQMGEVPERQGKIITTIYNSGMIGEIIHNISWSISSVNEDDLTQDILLHLCELPEEKVVKLYNDAKIKYFVAKMLLNQLNSKTSSYYYKYRRPSLLSSELPTDDGDEMDEIGGWE